MNSQTKRQYAMIVASALIAFAVLNRWVVTDLGIQSFSRLWQYYVSWTDFGFHRRGLVGTMLTVTRLNSLTSNEYRFAYIAFSVMLFVSYAVIGWVLRRMPALAAHPLLIACLLFSPATFSHFAYSTGNFDLLLFIIMLLCLFIVRSNIGFTVLLVIGLLVHELFVFMLPALFMIKYLEMTDAPRTKIKKLTIPAVAALLCTALIYYCGRLTMDASSYEAMMLTRIPHAAYAQPFWSGYFELTSTLADNHTFGTARALLPAYAPYMLIPTLYTLLFAGILAWKLKASAALRALMGCAVLMPFLLVALGTDYYRWASFSSCLSLLAILLFTARGRMAPLSKPVLLLLLSFSLLAPFGELPKRPFPLHQLVLERLQ